MTIRTLLLVTGLAMALPLAARDLLVVTGAPGAPEYQTAFASEAQTWSDFGRESGMKTLAFAGANRKTLQATLESLPKDGDELWIVLIGHGSFDGRSAKFSLAGDDITSKELAAWLKPFRRRVILLNFFSASGAFLPDLSGPNRVVVTATRSGGERNYTRFGEMFASGMTSAESDLDGDDAISLHECLLAANAATVDFYDSQQRIIPEHALLDDNGDSVGTEVRSLPKTDSKDGAASREIFLGRNPSRLAFTDAELRRRAELEAQIAVLKSRKGVLAAGAYYAQLEKLLLQIADLYDDARGRERKRSN